MATNEWGDFQTPPELAEQVLRTLPARPWSRILEPTCGAGQFLAAARALAAERIGIEIEPGHAARARATGATVLQRNVFDLDLARDLPWRRGGPLLVVGNPPWVTNADLGPANVPPKTNLRNLRGIDALTGASNFDLAEYVWVKLAVELADQNPTIALLCKTQVARNVLEYAHASGLALADATIRRVDARRWFGARVDACLFTATVGGAPDWVVPEFASLAARTPARRLGFASGRLVSDVQAHARTGFADGVSPVQWRQGVKHDAAAVMELAGLDPCRLTTRTGAELDLEPECVFPLLKGTDVHRGRLRPSRSVIVTQRRLGDDATSLAERAPRVWRYLQANGGTLDARRSSVYRGRSRFAMFGIGDYTFAPWKVAVCGLHAEPRFQLVGPVEGRPVVFDDTCYLLPFDDRRQAAETTALLRSTVVAELLRSLTFAGAKRPITKKVLQRIDLDAVARAVDRAEMRATVRMLLAPGAPDGWTAAEVAEREPGDPRLSSTAVHVAELGCVHESRGRRAGGRPLR